MRCSAVGTSDTSVAPSSRCCGDRLRRRSRRAPPAACRSTIARVTTDSPPTCDSGRQASQVSSRVHAEARRGRHGRRLHRVVCQHDTSRRSGGAARGDDQRVAVLDAAPVEVVHAVARRSSRSGAIASSSARRAAAEGVDRSGTLRRRRPRSAAARRRIDRRRGGRSQRGAARSEGYGDGRESVDTRRSPAHAPGRGRARGDRCRRRGRRAVAGVVAGRSGA